MSKKYYLLIKWDETKEKNNSRTGDDGEYDILIEDGMKIDLLGLNENSYIKEIKEDEVVVNIFGKGDYNIKLNETIKVTYSDGYQVCGDWVDTKLTYEITLSDKTLKEIKDALPDMEIVDNVLVKINRKKSVIEIPEGVSEIGHGVFYHEYINEIILPSTLKKIGSCAFCGCKFTKPLTLPEGLEEIGWMSIAYTNLNDLNIPNSIKKIDHSAFSGSDFYKKIENNEFIIFGDGVLYLYTGKEEKVIVPEGVKIVCPHAFYKTDDSLEYEVGKKHPTEIILPNSVELIHESAFFRLKVLQRINLNHNMTIHKDAFKESNYQSKFEEFLKENNE